MSTSPSPGVPDRNVSWKLFGLSLGALLLLWLVNPAYFYIDREGPFPRFIYDGNLRIVLAALSLPFIAVLTLAFSRHKVAALQLLSTLLVYYSFSSLVLGAYAVQVLNTWLTTERYGGHDPVAYMLLFILLSIGGWFYLSMQCVRIMEAQGVTKGSAKWITPCLLVLLVFLAFTVASRRTAIIHSDVAAVSKAPETVFKTLACIVQFKDRTGQYPSTLSEMSATNGCDATTLFHPIEHALRASYQTTLDRNGFRLEFLHRTDISAYTIDFTADETGILYKRTPLATEKYDQLYRPASSDKIVGVYSGVMYYASADRKDRGEGPVPDTLWGKQVAPGEYDVDGERITYQPRTTALGQPGFVLQSRPPKYGVTGVRSLYVDETGALKFTTSDRSATASDSAADVCHRDETLQCKLALRLDSNCNPDIKYSDHHPVVIGQNELGLVQYFGDDDGKCLLGWDPSGKLRFKIDTTIYSLSAVYENVFVLSGFERFYVLDFSGAIQWSALRFGGGSVYVDASGNSYIVDTAVRAYTPARELRWIQVDPHQRIVASRMAPDGSLLYLLDREKIWAVDPDGNTAWVVPNDRKFDYLTGSSDQGVFALGEGGLSVGFSPEGREFAGRYFQMWYAWPRHYASLITEAEIQTLLQQRMRDLQRQGDFPPAQEYYYFCKNTDDLSREAAVRKAYCERYVVWRFKRKEKSK